VRAEVLPVLRRRWPGAVAALNRSAANCRAAADLLAEDDARWLAACRADAKRGVFCLAPPLTVAALRGLGDARALRVLRRWLHGVGLRAPSAAQLDELRAQIFTTAGGELKWRGAEIHRHRDCVYLIGPPPAPPPAPVDWNLRPLDFGNGLRVEVDTVGDGVATAIDPKKLRGKRVQWAWRSGGERMQLPGRAHTHALKKLLQQTATPPWERRALPHLTVDDHIAWTPQIGPAANYATPTGLTPRFTVARACGLMAG